MPLSKQPCNLGLRYLPAWADQDGEEGSDLVGGEYTGSYFSSGYFWVDFAGIGLGGNAAAIQHSPVAQFTRCPDACRAFCQWAIEFTNRDVFRDFFDESLQQPVNHIVPLFRRRLSSLGHR
jgi:hypothetical protein